MSNRPFTDEQRTELLTNPYTHSISDSNAIKFTFEFKQYVWEQLQNGLKPKEIFQNAGYDYNALGKTRVHHYVNTVRLEGHSQEGLHDTTPKASQKAFKKTQDKAAIKELQGRVYHLEQQIEFLKKIALLDKMNESEK